MNDNYIPAHVNGRNFNVYRNLKDTLDLTGVVVGGYGRISTKKDSQKESIKNQEKYIAEWCEVNNYNLYDYYYDEKSGEFLYKRNDVNRLLEDLKNGIIKGIVTKEISRTSRDVMDTLELKRKIVSLGGFFISIKENYDSRTDDDEFFLILHAALAQKERKQTASRVKITQIIKAKEGKTNVPDPAFGYMLSSDRKYLIVNSETAPIHRLIVNKFTIERWGQLKIAKHLNELGIPSKRGKKWCTNAIKTILTNPVYLGVTIYNSTTLIRDYEGKQKRVVRPTEEWIIRENTHEPLITKEEFETIKNIMEERKVKDKKEWTSDRKYLGSSILRCAECGGKIYGSRYPKKQNGRILEDVYLYRYCCNGRNGECSKPMKYWDMEKVDELIINQFKCVFNDKEELLKEVAEELGKFEKPQTEIVNERDELNLNLSRLEKAIQKQQEAYEEEVITTEEYKNRMKELRDQRQGYISRLNQLNRKLSQADSVINKIERIFNEVNSKIENLGSLNHNEKVSLISSTFESISLTEDYDINDVNLNFL